MADILKDSDIEKGEIGEDEWINLLKVLSKLTLEECEGSVSYGVLMTMLPVEYSEAKHGSAEQHWSYSDKLIIQLQWSMWVAKMKTLPWQTYQTILISKKEKLGRTSGLTH